MKNKLGIFTALILSLMIAGSVFAISPKAGSAGKVGSLKATAGKTLAKKKGKHHRHHHKRKIMKKTMAPVAPKKVK